MIIIGLNKVMNI